jgi:hypothetical protein
LLRAISYVLFQEVLVVNGRVSLLFHDPGEELVSNVGLDGRARYGHFRVQRNVLVGLEGFRSLARQVCGKVPQPFRFTDPLAELGGTREHFFESTRRRDINAHAPQLVDVRRW